MKKQDSLYRLAAFESESPALPHTLSQVTLSYFAKRLEGLIVSRLPFALKFNFLAIYQVVETKTFDSELENRNIAKAVWHYSCK